MQQSERIRTLSLLMIPLDERACIIEDEFIMADNFNVTEKSVFFCPVLRSNLLSHLPIRSR